MFHSDADNVRITIPIAHIYGRRDKWRLHGADLVKLCDQDCTSVFEHDYGHEIPRSVSEEVCDVIETVISKAAS